MQKIKQKVSIKPNYSVFGKNTLPPSGFYMDMRKQMLWFFSCSFSASKTVPHLQED